MALGVLHCARHEFGLAVGETISIVGFDDIPLASWPGHGLTTICQPVAQICREAVEILIAQMEGGTPPQPQLMMPSEVDRAKLRWSASGISTPAICDAVARERSWEARQSVNDSFGRNCRRRQTRRICEAEQRHIVFEQQVARVIQSDVAEITQRPGTRMLAKQALDLPPQGLTPNCDPV